MVIYQRKNGIPQTRLSFVSGVRTQPPPQPNPNPNPGPGPPAPPANFNAEGYLQMTSLELHCTGLDLIPGNVAGTILRPSDLQDRGYDVNHIITIVSSARAFAPRPEMTEDAKWELIKGLSDAQGVFDHTRDWFTVENVLDQQI
ncbi:hypothetical protein MMC10_009754 [Thelotrema lepadinum]|nr:hypothetical protein [Thelotrema lepadinum]